MEPGVKSVRNGEIYVSWPEFAARRLMKPCTYCEGTGRDIQWETHPHRKTDPNFIDPCEMCDGKGESLQWETDFPSMNVSNYNMQSVIAPMLGLEFDYTGFVEHKDLPLLRRRLIRVMNGDEDFGREPSEDQKTYVDKSGDIPEIKRGALMIDFGVSAQQIERFVSRLIAIIDWAQKNNCGVRWA